MKQSFLRHTKIITSYETRRFTAVFTTVHH